MLQPRWLRLSLPDATPGLGWATVATASLAAGLIALAVLPVGPLARHMAAHILTMSVVAPALALAVMEAWPGRTGRGAAGHGLVLAAATVSQLILLWAWHAPPVLDGIGHTALGPPLMHLSLSAAALWFWMAVWSDRSALRWRALMALALTGKLFCLLGVLLVFAPRTLYPGHAIALGPAPADALADQQLAGLMMVVACPLTYVLAAVVIAARGLRDLAAEVPRAAAPTAPAR